MKQYKRALSLLLALVMVFSCVGTAFAAESKTTTQQAATMGKPNGGQKPSTERGFKNPEFIAQNTYQYADDEIVRAIIVLENEPVAEIAPRGTAQAETYSAALEAQHQLVYRAMKRIDYTLVYEFTSLLNGFSCDVAYGDLETVAELPGVKAVHIANTYAVPETQQREYPTMASSGILTGNFNMNDNGYTGDGLVVAVLDTGLNTTHEAFQDTSLVKNPALQQEDLILTMTKGAYLSEKVPFAYDYADRDNDVTDVQGHGTHVSGTIAGYCKDEDGAVKFKGGAPGAQLLSMKIFSDKGGGTTSDIYFYALEDAWRLGADVVNMSLGAQNGFTYDAELETEIFGNIYARLEQAGVILCVAAGNEYSMAEYSAQGYIGPEYTDYGTVASPSTYEGNISVASSENMAYPSLVLRIAGCEESFLYSDTSDDGLWMAAFGDKTMEFVVVPDASGVNPISFGYEADYEGVEVAGKVAVVSRGDISFEEKVEYAANAGAVGCIVVNNTPQLGGMSIETYEIPAIMVAMEAAEFFLSAEEKTVITPWQMEYVENSLFDTMSDFSNWGTTPTLDIAPAITSVGGMVYSAVAGESDAYEVYSGTSMATPNAACTFATLLQYLTEQGISDKKDRADLARDLMLSSATPLGGLDEDDNAWFYSVRKQGAGFGNAVNAMITYAESAYLTEPLQELGDDAEKTGIYEMTLTLKNDTSEEVTFSPVGYAMVDSIAEDAASGIRYNTMYSDLYGMMGLPGVTFSYEDGAGRTFGDMDTIAVPAEGAMEIRVTITLDAELKTYLDETFPNGTYVEGYVNFVNADTMDRTNGTTATYLAYYGDWTQAPVLEEEDFRDFLENDYLAGTTVADEEGNTYADLGYTGFDFMRFYTHPNMAFTATTGNELVWYLGGDILSGDYVPFHEEHMAFSTPLSNGSYYYADAVYMIPYQLRNANALIMTVTNKETGEVYYVDNTAYLSKAWYDTTSSTWQSTSHFKWDGTDASGSYVPDGTVAHIQYDAILPYKNTVHENVWSFDVTVDYTAPVIERVDFDEEAKTLTVTASDEHYLQAIYLEDAYYQVLDAVKFSSTQAGESFTATFDVSTIIEENDSVNITAVDYATNEAMQVQYFFEVGLDATVTLVTPAGTEEIPMKTGDTFVFPECDIEVENAAFYFWYEEPVEMIEEMWYLPGNWWFSDSTMLVKGDITFYALYATGSTMPLEKANYYVLQTDDYTGDWAICGMNFLIGDDGYGYFDTSHPMAIGDEGQLVDIAAEIEDVEISDWYIEFYTNDTAIRYTFERVGQDIYTIQSVKSGKYLAMVDGQIGLTDTVTDEAKWTITPNTKSAAGSLAYNVAHPQMLLTYYDEEQVFAVMDDSVPYYEDYYPRDLFVLWLYSCVEEELVVEGYTTELKLPAQECHYTQFSDCTADWYHEAVDFTVANGLMQGVGNGRFDPNGTMSRAMMVTVLYRMAGSPQVEAPSTFTDVPADSWYADAVAWAQANGIVLGVRDDVFAPNAAITREQMATILWRYTGEPEASADLTIFKDVEKISDFADEAMIWAVSQRLFIGDNGNLKPTAGATRAEAACVIMRYLDGFYICDAE